MKTHANTANRFTAWHQRKNALARDMVAFSRIGHFFLSQRVGGKSSVSVCCFKYGAFSRRIHIIGSRVATHSSIPHLFRQTKWRLVFSQGGISIWVGERNFSYSQCSKFYWAPTLPTLSWDGKIGVIKFISDFKTCMLEFQLIKILESNHFTVTNIRSHHKLRVCKSRPHGSRWFVSVFVSGTLHDTK